LFENERFFLRKGLRTAYFAPGPGRRRDGAIRTVRGLRENRLRIQGLVVMGKLLGQVLGEQDGRTGRW
jgi:hypothetical protein